MTPAARTRRTRLAVRTIPVAVGAPVQLVLGLPLGVELIAGEAPAPEPEPVANAAIVARRKAVAA